MTKVIIKTEPGRYDITITGHAEKINEEEGNILCAALSTLAQTLLQMVRDMEDENRLKHSEKLSDGRIRVICTYQSQDRYIEGVFRTIETGFLLLQNGYKKNISVVGENKIGS